MSNPVAWLQYKLGSLIKRLEEALNGPTRDNPVYVEWMGEDICWRLHGIKDAIGEDLDNTSAYKNYERLTYDVEDDHEHCDACWASIYKDVEGHWATSEYYSNENSGDQVQALFCPVCYSLFEAVCRGVITIEVTKAAALATYQLEENHWKQT